MLIFELQWIIKIVQAEGVCPLGHDIQTSGDQQAYHHKNENRYGKSLDELSADDGDRFMFEVVI